MKEMPKGMVDDFIESIISKSNHSFRRKEQHGLRFFQESIDFCDSWDAVICAHSLIKGVGVYPELRLVTLEKETSYRYVVRINIKYYKND